MALFEIKHRLTRAVLFSFECDSFRICVEAAVKARADLTGANLTGAYLARADLAGAYLAGANYVISLGYPNGWPATAWFMDGVVRVQVGCRNFTLAEGRAYWTGKTNRQEVLAALDYAERVADLRGWTVTNKQEAA